MSGGIYLLQESGELVEMTERAYDSEALLQELLGRYPRLLAGDQMAGAEPRRWLLVRRETPIPAEADAAGRWSVDHLFLDQDGVPSLVEVKRSCDTRIRREVVGQMLDYAANAVVYWPVEALRAHFEAGAGTPGRDPEAEMAALLGPDGDQDELWKKVKTNLEAGRVRLVFVADDIPVELRRVVEFLNEQMDPAEVLAVEVRQYVGEGLRTLVPRVVGQTARKAGPGPASSTQWDEASFLQDLEARNGAAAAGVAREILAWARKRGLRFSWGKGQTDGSFYPMLDYQGTSHWTFSVWTYGRAEIQFQYMQPPFDQTVRRQDILSRLNKVAGIAIPADATSRRPGIPLTALEPRPALEQFFEVWDWMIDQIRNPAASSPAEPAAPARSPDVPVDEASDESL
jgi:hypothetical protein